MNRKVFFFSPHKIIADEIINRIARNEYEVFSYDNPAVTEKLLQKYSNSIIFINIDTIDRDFFDSLLKNLAAENAIICTVSYNGNSAGIAPSLAVNLSDRPDNVSNAFLRILEENGAKEQRKYVRFGGQEETIALFKFNYKNKSFAGIVHDISSVGMSVSFEQNIDFEIDTNIKEIQLKLNGKNITISGQISTKRQNTNGDNVFVVMFSRRISKETVALLQSFIYYSHKTQMDNEIARM